MMMPMNHGAMQHGASALQHGAMNHGAGAMNHGAMNHGADGGVPLPCSQFNGSTYKGCMGVLGGALARVSGQGVGVHAEVFPGAEEGEREGEEGAMQGVENGHDHAHDSDPHRQAEEHLVGLTELTFKGPIIGGVYQHCFEGYAPLVAPPTAAGTYNPPPSLKCMPLYHTF